MRVWPVLSVTACTRRVWLKQAGMSVCCSALIKVLLLHSCCIAACSFLLPLVLFSLPVLYCFCLFSPPILSLSLSLCSTHGPSIVSHPYSPSRLCYSMLTPLSCCVPSPVTSHITLSMPPYSLYAHILCLCPYLSQHLTPPHTHSPSRFCYFSVYPAIRCASSPVTSHIITYRRCRSQEVDTDIETWLVDTPLSIRQAALKEGVAVDYGEVGITGKDGGRIVLLIYAAFGHSPLSSLL